MFNAKITTKWRKEIQDIGEDVNEQMLDWIIEEVQWKSTIFPDAKHIVAYDIGVVKSDVDIPEELRRVLVSIQTSIINTMPAETLLPLLADDQAAGSKSPGAVPFQTIHVLNADWLNLPSERKDEDITAFFPQVLRENL
ncbi:hypothetical protein Aspvir_006254 [Aspergillus viridinutans]|uniref:DUF4246 domain-containing protein n=1 Tax=Aspergillus viridinutans TaxID=75553 RepID=A0A9P3BYM2_ASPVI|nr:uncharacterized protein Aspvir_006254 [Aspergillus viridinutans]GIK02206.1 hypothetical protein Aspvir_006254 [Aspergillus viridinutans]